MKYIIQLFLFVSFFSFGQCPPSNQNLVLSTQQQVDDYFVNYPGCTELNNQLNIGGEDITNLNGLNGITYCRRITIANNPLLSNIDGLNSLTSIDAIGEIRILNNPLLENLNAFNNVTVDNQSNTQIDITITDNAQLTSINGLQGLQGYSSYIRIENNDLLPNIDGLNGIIGIEDLFIEGNDSLTNIDGLSGPDYEGVRGVFYFVDNDAVSSISSSAYDDPTDIRIRNNEMLTNIDRFFNDMVEENGFLNLLIIENNPNLSFCSTDFICSVLADLVTIQVSNNDVGCDTIFEIGNACGVSYNDNCEGNSIPEIILEEPIQANTNFATTSSSTPSCNDENRDDVWFRFNSGDLENVDIIVTTGFSIQLWEGACSDLALVADACAEDELLNVPVTTNTNYYLQVWQYPNNRSVLQGDFELLVTNESLSVSANVIETISLYPNPSSSKLTIKGISNETLNAIKIYSILGKHVGDYSNTSIDISNFKSGVYFIEVTTNTGAVTKRFIKE